ncbi:hypothetical protein [Mycobacterium scrofulaceum]|uniref:hypothetical protein n=1 Tax=Mycobacterium scrofulaceum TaxID=1783 RepID=UPI0012EA4508|nr:hypothetical protein [Mycobacterium scrofulaceum]
MLEQLKLNMADPADDCYANGYASWTTILDLAGGGAARAQIESTRRAVLKLAASGLVETRYVRRQRPVRSTRLAAYGDPCRLYRVHVHRVNPLLLAARSKC